MAIGRRSEARAALDRRRIAERGGDPGRGRSRSAPARERPRLGRRGGGSRGGDPPRADPRARAVRPAPGGARVPRSASESRRSSSPATKARRPRFRRTDRASSTAPAGGSGSSRCARRRSSRSRRGKPDGGPSGPRTVVASASSRAASSRSSMSRAGRSRRSPTLPRRAAPPGDPTERSCSRRDFRGGLMRVSASGGAVSPLTTVDTARHTTHRWPSFLPDGKNVIFLAANHGRPRSDESGIYVVPLSGGTPKRLLTSYGSAQAVNGWLMSVRESSLMAAPFDAARLTVTGPPVQAAPDVQFDTEPGAVSSPRRPGSWSTSIRGMAVGDSSGGTTPRAAASRPSAREVRVTHCDSRPTERGLR